VITVAGELTLAAPRPAVFAALDDPGRLAAALPHVDDFAGAEDDGSFHVTIRPAIALGEVPFATTWRRVERSAPVLLRYEVRGRSAEHLLRLDADLWLADADAAGDAAGGPGTRLRWEAACGFTGIMRAVGQRTLAAVVRHQAELVLRAAAVSARAAASPAGG